MMVGDIGVARGSYVRYLKPLRVTADNKGVKDGVLQRGERDREPW